jgi:hypothetical protein
MVVMLPYKLFDIVQVQGDPSLVPAAAHQAAVELDDEQPRAHQPSVPEAASRRDRPKAIPAREVCSVLACTSYGYDMSSILRYYVVTCVK